MMILKILNLIILIMIAAMLYKKRNEIQKYQIIIFIITLIIFIISLII